MATVNEALHDELWLHHSYINRYAASATVAATSVILSTEAQISYLIFLYLNRMEGVNPLSKKGRKLIKEFEDKVKALRLKAWQDATNNVVTEAKSFAKLDHNAQVKLFDEHIPVAIGMQPLETSIITSIVTAQPFEGRTVREWMSRSAAADIERVTRAARLAMVNGETVQQATARIIGSKKYNFKDGASRKFRSNIETNLITAINGISNSINVQLVAENTDIISYEVFAATLDIRTTKICASNDGKKFKAGEGPVPPLHMRCRSRRLPVVTEEAFNRRGMDPTFEKELVEDFARKNGLGKVSSVGDLPYGYKTAYNKWMRKERRSRVGDVPAEVTFEQWLHKRNKQFQDEYFGSKRKAELFRNGKLSLDKFVTRDGYELTIVQLEKLVS